MIIPIILSIIIVILIIGIIYYSYFYNPQTEKKEKRPYIKINSNLSIGREDPVKLRGESRGKGIISVIDGEYWVSFYLPEQPKTTAEGKLKNMAREIGEELNSFYSAVEVYDKVNFQISRFAGLNQGIYFRVKVGSPSNAMDIIDKVLYEFQTKAMETAGVPMVTNVAPFSLWAETLVPTKKINPRVIGEDKEDEKPPVNNRNREGVLS